jgi:glycine/D-amino acid oxidase-like deaminating enzyme
MPHLIHPDSLHFETPVESYWECSANALNLEFVPLTQTRQCEVAIIGGGYTGLSAALELAESGIDVCLLEAGHIGWGASGRNGGFACIGSHKLGYRTMIKRYGLEATKDFHNAMRDSVDLVADNAARHNIDIWKHGNGEVTLAHLPGRFEDLRASKEFYERIFGEYNQLLSVEDLKERGMQAPHFHGGLQSQTGFGIHPLNYARGLAGAAHKAGAKLFPHSKLVRWEQNEGKHVLYTEQGQLIAKQVIIATNAYTPEGIAKYHAGRILPALSSIIVTRPLTQHELQSQGWTSSIMAYDSRQLLHYFRLLPNNRFLFGGRGGTDSSNASEANYQQHITQTFRRLFPAWAKADITHFWRGHVCLSFDRVPYMGPLDDGRTVWTALAYHGNGVAMGTWSGRALARMMLNKTGNTKVPAVITRRLAKFPLPMFRPYYIKGAYLWYGWQDEK